MISSVVEIKRIIINTIVNITYCLQRVSKKNALFSLFYRVYKLFLRIISIYPYQAISHSEYVKYNSTSIIQPITDERVCYTSNTVFDDSESDSQLIPVTAPKLYLAIHKNVRISGNSDLIIDVSNKFAINDFASSVQPPFGNRDGILFRQKNTLLLLKFDENADCQVYDSGIMITGKFSSNYYHVMYEILIKMLIVDELKIQQDIPFVIDKVILKVNSFHDIFITLNRTNRKYIAIENNDNYEFKSLYYISPVNIIPPHVIDPDRFNIRDVVFDLSYLKLLRDRLLTIKSKKIFSKRIYLSRKKSSRRSFNEDDVISCLNSYDFEVVSPEDYSLADQISMFNGAEIIVGGVGAAMTNLLFCNATCQIICLNSMKVIIPVFSTIAFAQGARMRCLVGQKSKIFKSNDVHSDYFIDVRELKKNINTLL